MKVLVTGGSGFIGSHLVDALVAGGHAVVVVDRRPCAYPNPSATYVRPTCATRACGASALAGVDAVSHQAARVGLGVRFADVTDYVADNDAGTAVAAGRPRRRRFRRPAGTGLEHGRLRRGRLPLPGLRPGGRPAPHRRAAGRRRASSRTCPRCGADLVPEAVTEGGTVRPAQHLRRHQGPPRAPLHRVRPRTRRAGHLPALPQRLRAALPGRHPLRRGGQPLRGAPCAAARRPGSSRTVASAATSCTCTTWRGPTWPPWWPSRRSPAPSTSPRGSPGPSWSWPPPWPMRRGRPDLAPVVTGQWRLGDVRHVTASAERAAAELGFVADRALRRRDGRAGRRTGLNGDRPAGAAGAEVGRRARRAGGAVRAAGGGPPPVLGHRAGLHPLALGGGGGVGAAYRGGGGRSCPPWAR